VTLSTPFISILYFIKSEEITYGIQTQATQITTALRQPLIVIICALIAECEVILHYVLACSITIGLKINKRAHADKNPFFLTATQSELSENKLERNSQKTIIWKLRSRGPLGK
jgi:hypothetical protein